MTIKMKKNRSEFYCKAKTQAGKACRAAAMAGGLCFFHANPTKAAELGRIGGRRNARTPAVLPPTPLLDTPEQIREMMQRVFVETYCGQLGPRIAAVLDRLLNTQLRVMESANFDERLKRVEERGAAERPSDAQVPTETLQRDRPVQEQISRQGPGVDHGLPMVESTEGWDDPSGYVEPPRPRPYTYNNAEIDDKR